MASDKKKSTNFSAKEIGVLVDEIAASKTLLFSKFGQPGVSNAAKNDRWRRIAELVTAVGGGEVRSVDAVKKKWYDVASKTKKKESLRRKGVNGTGGGTNSIVMTAEEEQVVEILGNEAIEGIEGGFDVGFGGMKKEVIADAVMLTVVAEVESVQQSVRSLAEAEPVAGYSGADIVAELKGDTSQLVQLTELSAKGEKRPHKVCAGVKPCHNVSQSM